MKTKRASILPFLLALALAPAGAAVRYVNLPNPNSVPPYTTWDSAATNIQDAIDAANAGDAIVVTNGFYQAIQVPRSLTVQSVNGPDVTIIDGGGFISCASLGSGSALSGFTLTHGYCESVFCAGGVSASDTAIVSNCMIIGNIGSGAYGGTLNNCTLSRNSAHTGGGVQYGTLNNCTLSGNSAIFGGGAYQSTLKDCVLTGNTADNGGGAWASTLINCMLIGNSAQYGGGGAASTGWNPPSTLINCKLTANSSQYGGGASGSALNNCTVTGNSAKFSGGGVHFGSLNNCTITENSAGSDGGGVFGGEMRNCIVYFNTAQSGSGPNYWNSSFQYSCTTPLPPGPGNIDAAPGFVDLEGGVYHLNACSPCIDTGTNLGGVTDLDGAPRPRDGNRDGLSAFDMGAYEFDPQNIVVPTDPLAILREVIGSDGRLHLSVGPTRAAAYYILYRGTTLNHIDTPIALKRGADCAVREMIDPTPVTRHGMTFYRAREVPVSQPLDSDGDDIDDVYELRHVRFLNPLDPADAAQDFDRDGRSNLQEYLASSNPARPSGQALAANDQGWFALKTNGSLWFFDVSQNQLQRVGGNSNYVAVFPGGFAVAAADGWVAGSLSYPAGGGESHTLALKIDGSLWAWGANSFGQSGDGTYDFSSIPIHIGTSTDWSDVAAGSYFSAAIKGDGTLWAWGFNGSGELGNGTNDQGTNVPIQIGPDHNWIAVDNSKFDSFEAYTLALKSDGSLWSWGNASYGALGLGGICCPNSPTRVGTISDWRCFSAGALHVIALKTDGSLWTWGGAGQGCLALSTPTRIGTDTNWDAVAAGVDLSVALRTDGTLWSWKVGESPQQIGTDTDWGSLP